MKPGDLRRFRRDVISLGADHLAGCNFMVVDVVERRKIFPEETPVSGAMDAYILVGGKVVGPWGCPWVKENSEVVSEAR